MMNEMLCISPRLVHPPFAPWLRNLGCRHAATDLVKSLQMSLKLGTVLSVWTLVLYKQLSRETPVNLRCSMVKTLLHVHVQFETTPTKSHDNQPSAQRHHTFDM